MSDLFHGEAHPRRYRGRLFHRRSQNGCLRRNWWNRPGPMHAIEIRRKRAQQLRAYSNWKWHVYELFVKMDLRTRSFEPV